MTIAAAVPTWVQIPGNSSATVFAFPFKIFQATDLIVGFITATGYAQQTSGFTVPTSGIDVNGGGSITFTTPPPTGTTVDIRTQTPMIQNTEFANLGAFLPENHTEAFDRLTRTVQDLYRLAYTFGIHGPDQENMAWTALPVASQRKNNALMFDSNGLPTIGTLVSQALTQSLIGQFLYPQTAAEIAAGVTPTNYAYAPGDVRRYGADATGISDSAAAFLSAWKGNGMVIVPVGTFAIKSAMVFPGSGAIIGSNLGTSSIVMSSAGAFTFGDSSFITRVFYITLENLTINGNNRGQNTTALSFYNVSIASLFNLYMISIKGQAIHCERSYDSIVAFCSFQYCGDNNLPAVSLPYVSGGVAGDENNHWTFFDCHFEANYWTDLYFSGLAIECDHFVTNCKFGVPSYTPSSATDVAMYHIQAISCVGVRIIDNWFFVGGMVYAISSTATAIQNNYGAELSQGIWMDSGCVLSQIGENHIEGNNDNVNAITGSRTTNHWGIRIGGMWDTITPGNDVTKFWTDYRVWAGASGCLVEFPVSSGQPCLLGSDGAGPVIVDAGTSTTIQQLDVASVALTLQNSWTAGSFATPSYSRNGNLICLKGVPHGGTITAGTTITTLPVNYRPPDNRIFPVYTDNGTTAAPGYLEVLSTGAITIVSVPAGTTNISLDGIVFSVI